MSKPDAYLNLQRHQPELVDAYERFAAAGHEAGPLSERERRLVKLALALASGMEGATHSAARQARDVGLSADDLRHVAFLGASTLGFPAMMRGLTWISDVTEES
jgi:alkylhydroperoxidase/carboxymuconolactone decarboxylase family protein YurZ